MNHKLLFLPGLDGTGKLLQDFVRRAPDHVTCEIVTYESHLTTLDDFVNAAASKLSPETKTIIVAESFSGPIAAEVTARFPDYINAIIFAASFVEPPHGLLLKLARVMPALVCESGSMRKAVVRQFCLNGVHDKMMIDEANTVIGALDSEVIKRRLTTLSNIAISKTSKSSHTAVLDFRAARDHLVTASSAASIARTFQNAATVVFKAPHFLLLTQPEECWFHIEKFLADMA